MSETEHQHEDTYSSPDNDVEEVDSEVDEDWAPAAKKPRGSGSSRGRGRGRGRSRPRGRGRGRGSVTVSGKHSVGCVALVILNIVG